MPYIYARCANIVTRKIAGETILVPIHQRASDMENIYVLNEVGSAIWELLDGKRNTEEMGDILLEEFETTPSEIEKDVAQFLSSLEETGLVKSS